MKTSTAQRYDVSLLPITAASLSKDSQLSQSTPKLCVSLPPGKTGDEQIQRDLNPPEVLSGAYMGRRTNVNRGERK